MGKQLTIADLLSEKEKLKRGKRRTANLYIESLDGEITIQEPDRSIAIEALTMAQDDSRSQMADPYIVYHCVVQPDLKDAQLQKEFGCVEPTDIVGILFRPGEIAAISGHALKLAGFGEGVRKVDRDIKN
ncbi:hypothetical protein QO009_001455 [Brevibacillus aydinogluensis]|uniref:phage tail assembly chaperone n=1 Tax=Brevibacillus aydinogluensis TaxID=927786 RepID=UPI00289301B1|nr:hypothetical protein [Brevibacillus aydinogluensis]MDT3415597.1 hypothetical protein [Brevibacillus aydinogluensis]